MLLAYFTGVKMAAHVPTAPGYLQMLMEGVKYYRGMQEAIFSNIQACKVLAQCLRTSYGPNGMNKLVINHRGKIFFTANAANILRELEIENPAAKLLLLASQTQEEEVGDGTNFVITLAGTLLENAEELLRMGLPVSDVMVGYEKASKKALEILETLSCSSLDNLRDVNQVTAAIRTAIASKQCGCEDILSGLIAKACISVMPNAGSFNTDSVRVCKIVGSGIHTSLLIEGMVFQREVEGSVTSVSDAKVVFYSCPFDTAHTVTNGTVLIRKAEELVNFSEGEETLMESHVCAIASSGIKVIVVGGRVGDLALHFAEKNRLMVVKMTSRYDMKRLCKALGATELLQLTAPLPEETGHCDQVYMTEIGNTHAVVFKQEKLECPVATLILRGATENLLDSVEEAVRDGVNIYLTLTKDNRLVPGAGATEMELALQVTAYGKSCPGLEQYAIMEFAKALESVTRALAENAGLRVNQVISKLYAAHQQGNKMDGVGAEKAGKEVIHAAAAGILDPLLVKHWGIKIATNAVATMLSVDQIIIAKKSGGPKVKGENPNWDLEPDHID